MLSREELFTAMPASPDPFEDVRARRLGTPTRSALSCLPMFTFRPCDQPGILERHRHCVNLCNDPKYFYRDLGPCGVTWMAVVLVLLEEHLS